VGLICQFLGSEALIVKILARQGAALGFFADYDPGSGRVHRLHGKGVQSGEKYGYEKYGED
jgi:hypothetical protein